MPTLNTVGGYTAMRRVRSSVGMIESAHKKASELLVGDYIDLVCPGRFPETLKDQQVELSYVVMSISVRKSGYMDVTFASLDKPERRYTEVRRFKPDAWVEVTPHGYLKQIVQAQILQQAGLTE